MKKSIGFILCFLLFAAICAQTNYTIIGTVSTMDGYTPSGNIIALSAVDSSFVKGDFFLDGSFRLEDLQDTELIIQLTSLEFEDTFISISNIKDSLIDLGHISLDKGNLSLDEVVVIGRRPIYVQEADGSTAVLVENSTLAASNTVNEILSKSPDVLVDEDGMISVFGKGAALIYLNGKRIDQNQLKLVTPSSIKKLIIIRNPSAKYDAEGAAVIDIQTIKNTAEGYQVKITQNASYSSFAGVDTYSEFNLAFNTGRFSSKLNYSLMQGKDRHILHTTRNRDAEEVYLQTDLLTEWQHDYENFSNYGVGLQYDYGTSSYLSIEYSGNYEQLGGNQLSTNKIEDRTSTNFYESDIQRDETDVNHSYSLNFQQALDTIGSTLFIGGQYSNFNFQSDNPIDELSIESDISSSRSLNNMTALNIDILTGQFDYTKIYRNQASLEMGGRFSKVGNGSNFIFSEANAQGTFILDPSLSNQFDYQESIIAGYLNYNGQLNSSLQYVVGIRSEYTSYELELSQEEGLNISDRYANVFPQFSLTKTFSNNRSINLSYTSRIRRVPYQRLNPVPLYQDPYTSIQGNPASIPEKTQAIEFNAKLNKTNFRLGYSHTVDPFGGGAIRGDDDKSYILMRLNFNETHRFFTSVSRTFETPWISSTNTVSLRFTDIIDNVFSFADVGSKPNLYLYSINRIPFKNWFNTELSFYYIGDNDEGLYKRKNSWSMNLALDKSFLDKALKCQLIVNDIFHSVRAAGDYSIGETDIFFGRRWNTNYVRLSISYNFGKLKENNYKNKEIGSDENSRAR